MKRRSVAILGAVALLPIAWGLMRHTMPIPEAAKRAVIVLVVLWLLEAVVLPLLTPMLQPREPATPPAEPAPDAGGA